VPDSWLAEPIVLTPKDRERITAEIAGFVEPHGASEVPIDMTVSEGDAADEILRQAAALPADMIVMGTHGRSGFRRLLLGSVTEKVLRQARCPVMSVPHAVADTGIAPAPVLFKRMLCAVDFSDCSLNALNYALSLAQEADAHLVVLHVREWPGEWAEPLGFANVDWDAMRQAYEREGLARLQDAIPDSVRAYCTVDMQVVEGKPYQAILQAAAEQRSELIVMGIHGRGAIDLLFFGSTAQHVVRQATCPVLTLRTR
jgi:nucleotide-binding universal stress UspA family protein